jgi:cytochrome P450
MSRLNNPLTTVLPYDLPGLPYRTFLDAVARYDAAMRALIARKRAGGGDNRDVLAMLLQSRDEESGASLSEEEVVGHVGALFAAGHETTANTLTWTLFLLSQHPHICAELLDELEQVLGGAAPSVEQLEQLPLLDRVLKESMRIIPVVPAVFRRSAEDVELGGYLVPAHTEIFTSTYATHHLPEIYAEPERFLPGRWETITPSPFEYSPFSVGPRMCIGATFALFEMKIVLAMLLQRFRLELPAGARVDRFGFITLSPRGGLTMLAHRQDRQFSRGVGGTQGNVREMVILP